MCITFLNLICLLALENDCCYNDTHVTNISAKEEKARPDAWIPCANAKARRPAGYCPSPDKKTRPYFRLTPVRSGRYPNVSAEKSFADNNISQKRAEDILGLVFFTMGEK